MLTIKQINEISFRKSSFSGYKPEDVDDFIDEVGASFTTLAKENQAYKAKAAELSAKNAEMREKLAVLAERIEAYRDDEEGIKNVLLSAQKLGSASIKEAKSKAEAIVAQANSTADLMVEEAKRKTTTMVESYKGKIDAKQKEYDTIKATVTAFRSSLFEMYRNHLGTIEAIPDFSGELRQAKIIQEAAAAPMAEQELTYEPPVDHTSMAQAPQSVSEIEEIDEVAETEDLFSDYDEVALPDDYAPESVSKESFDEIDFNAYSDIPEALKQDKAALYSTLEFGEDIDVKRK